MEVEREDAAAELLSDSDVVQEDLSSKPLLIKKKPIYSFFKRLLDIVLSFLGLIVLAVPFLILSIIILIDSPGASPIYSQERIGKNGKVFKIYKFRSMVPNAEAKLSEVLDKNEMDGPVFKMQNDPRITRVGRFIRKASIDEFPQLWNVFKGDMSLVGPRPPLGREVDEYTEEQKIRVAIKPGITCYWQIQPKRNSLSFEEWLALDVKYINERGFFVDIKILFRTIGAVFGLEGE